MKPACLPPRRGSLLVFTLVVLAVVALIAGVLVAGLLRGHRQALLAERSLQADLLAEAGVRRAVVRLRDDPSYDGETWAIPAAPWNGGHAGLVAIAVDRDPGEPALRTIRVRADYPEGEALRARSRRHLQFPYQAGPTPEGDSP